MAQTPEYDWDGYGFETRQVHAGEYYDQRAGSRVPPIAATAGYLFDDFDDQVARFAGTADPSSRIYSRQGNPTNQVAEERLASLEGGVETVLVSSGQAAITAALFTLAKSGDNIVSTASIYGGTRILFARGFKRAGIDVRYVWDASNDSEWEQAITPETKAIYTESIPNPLNDIVDLERIVAVANKYDLPVVVDNTIATPALCRPAEFGVHVVVHSTTKYLTGHGAVVSGAVVDIGNYDWAGSSRDYSFITDAPAGRRSYLEMAPATAYAKTVREGVVNDLGFQLSPFTGFLLQQGMETLSLRMERHTENALALAKWLETQPEVERVDHAGLESNLLHELQKTHYPNGTSAVFGFTVRGGIDSARAFTDALTLVSRMTGIGDTRSMVLHPKTTTHASFPEELNARLGITDNLLRLSIGLESVADIQADLRRGLDAVAALNA